MTDQDVMTEAEETRYAELQLVALDLARQGEIDALAPMLRAGLPVNLADAKGNSLLMLACYHGHFEIARLLLSYKAEVDRRNDRGQTPLGGAAFKGDAEIVALLLEHDADVDADNGNGMTPIMFAAMFGRTQVVEELQSHGASLRSRTRFGISANHMVRLSRWITRFFRPDSSPPHERPANKQMKSELPSLLTTDAAAGIVLAASLADQLQAQFTKASAQLEHPGGTNYLLPAPVPHEVIGSILFYAIAAANQGWPKSKA